jgi:virulence factor Mce-like protein
MRARRCGVTRLVLVAVVLVTVAVGCGRPGDGGYHLKASFPRAVALYSLSLVKVMGINVGHVSHIEVLPDHIEVEMQIDRNVPLPGDVEASIVPLSLIGERNIVLSPAWKPGDDKAEDGHVIPPERTHVPIEPDVALTAITDLANAIDPNAVQKLIHNGAAALDGQGQNINDSLSQTSSLVTLLASQDQTLLSIADSFHKLTAVLEAREGQLGKLLDDFATATNVLATERDAIATFLRALNQLTQSGQALLTSYQMQLPQDVASLASVVLTLQVNAGSLQQLIRSVDDLGQGVIEAYDPGSGGAKVRITGSSSVMLDIQAIFDLLVPGLPVPCIPIGGVACPG